MIKANAFYILTAEQVFTFFSCAEYFSYNETLNKVGLALSNLSSYLLRCSAIFTQEWKMGIVGYGNKHNQNYF